MKVTEQAMLILAIGAGATAIVDLWALLRRKMLGVPPPNYAFLGRWIGRMRHGEFRHAAIARAIPVHGEKVIGWIAHYVIGMLFAALIPALFGVVWLGEPELLPALGLGIATVAAPVLLMQPAMGNRHTPRLQSVVTHAIFGTGLYATALMLAALR